MIYKEINERYSTLADSDCCLSCGGAINYSGTRPGETCIDLGSGRGTDSLRLAETVGENGLVYGIDISDNMIRKANSNADRLGIKNVRFVQTSLENTGLHDDIADLIISNCTINHSTDKQAVWNEIYRLLKDGGRFVVSDIYSLSPVPEEFKNDPVAISECWAGSVTREEYLDQVHKAGFRSVKIIEESAPYSKGRIMVTSWTVAGIKQSDKCNCGLNN